MAGDRHIEKTLGKYLPFGGSAIQTVFALLSHLRMVELNVILAPICSGHADRLHDCRARNVIEAIMWHGCSREGGQSDARWSVEKFRQLSKADRDAVVKFINAI